MDHVSVVEVLPADVVGSSDEFTLLGFIVAAGTNQSVLGGTWDRIFYIGFHYRIAMSRALNLANRRYRC